MPDCSEIRHLRVMRQTKMRLRCCLRPDRSHSKIRWSQMVRSELVLCIFIQLHARHGSDGCSAMRKILITVYPRCYITYLVITKSEPIAKFTVDKTGQFRGSFKVVSKLWCMHFLHKESPSFSWCETILFELIRLMWHNMSELNI
jgi:hypothetical protein